MFDLFNFMPDEGSSWASTVDSINNFITNTSIACIVIITAVMLYFAVKYRRKSEDQPTAFITHNTVLETVWTVVPTVVCIVVFVIGFRTYHEMRNPPANALEINVDGQKWAWSFLHSNGRKAANELVVPVNTPVRLIMRSKDVLHSFFIPSMRVKEDVLPSNYSYIWFTPTKTGDFPIFCAEYCGQGHSEMRAKLRVVSAEEYRDYLLDRSAEEIPPAQKGEQLFGQVGCKGCHSTGDNRIVGPGFKGLFSGKPHTFADGTSLVPDENYVRESLMNPNAKIVAGFPSPSPMPAQTALSEKDIEAIIAYLKTL